MKVRDLRLALSRLSPALSQEETDQLDQLLTPADDLTISEFCAATKIKVPNPKRPRVPVAVKINERLVSDYVAELRAHMATDVGKATIERLKKDKGVKVPEAIAIARQIVGERTYKTKSEALKAIEQRRVADARASHRRSHISEIF